MCFKIFLIVLLIFYLDGCASKKPMPKNTPDSAEIIEKGSVNSNLLGAWKDEEIADSEEISFYSEFGTNTYFCYLHQRLSSTGIWYFFSNRLVIIENNNSVTNLYTNISFKNEYLVRINDRGMVEKYKRIK